MKHRPYVLLSCAMSIDGYIDDATPERLLLSNEEDFDRVDGVRATSDAILVGANTIRRDDPRLLVRSDVRIRERVARGMDPHPIKVTVTSSGKLDPNSKFFTTGNGLKLVYCPPSIEAHLREALGGRATVINAGDPLDLHSVLRNLAQQGVGRLMVEGGATIHTQFLTAGLADELHLAVCAFFVGDPDAPRFVGPGAFPWNGHQRMKLAEVKSMGDVVLLRYFLPKQTTQT
jgi:5-amino-6-(5-phosphoribosylamino)uracil reductase